MAQKLTFEHALKELEGIVRQLEDGKLTLDESLAQFKRGCELIEYCNGKLKDAKLVVEELSATLIDDVEGETDE